MSNQKLLIQKKTFEVETLSDRGVNRLQDRISNLVNYRMTRRMENYLEAVVPEDILLRMNLLVLEVGEVRLESLEDEIEERVMELLEEEFSTGLEISKSSPHTSGSGISVENINTGDLELLEYFLINGILPWYSGNKDSQGIDGIIEALFLRAATALKLIIQRAGKSENVRKRIAYQFSERSLRQIILLLEPSEAEYIFQTHKEIIKLQEDKQIVQPELKEFKKIIWLFILNYMLAETSSEFNKKMFVRSNISQMAAYLNVSYQEILEMLHDSFNGEKPELIYHPLQTVINELMAEEYFYSSGPTLLNGSMRLEGSSELTLFNYYLRFGSAPDGFKKIDNKELAIKLLTLAKIAPGAVKEILILVKESSDEYFRLRYILKTEETKTAFDGLWDTKLYDVLLHILQYGCLPWWGQEFFGYTITNLAEELYKTHPKEMVLVFRQSILNAAMRERLLSNVPISIARKVMIELPAGKIALSIIDQFLGLLNESKLFRYHNEDFIQKSVFAVAWEILSQTRYTLFSTLIFLIESILRFSAISGLRPEEFTQRIIQAELKNQETYSNATLKEFLFTSLRYLAKENKTEENKIFTETYPRQRIERRFPVPEPTGIDKKKVNDFIFNEPGKIVHLQNYFLIAEVSPTKLISLISGALHFYLLWNCLPDSFGIIEESDRKNLIREMLLILFEHDRQGLKRLLQDEVNSTVARMSLNEVFLESEGGTEKKIALYLFENCLPDTREIYAERKHHTDFNTNEEAYPLSLYNIFEAEGIIEEERSDVRVFKNSYNTFEYFLKYNHLPPDLDINFQNTDTFLSGLMIFLYSKDRELLRQLFQNSETLPEARFYLYNLLATGNLPITDELSAFVGDQIERDLIALLSQYFAGDSGVSPKIFSPSFSKLIFDRYGSGLFFKMVMHKIKSFPDGELIVRGLLALIRNAVKNIHHREVTEDLFWRFNIIFLSGKSDIYNGESYAQAFIKYLSRFLSAGSTKVYEDLFEYLSLPEQDRVPEIKVQKNLLQLLLRPLILQLKELDLIKESVDKSSFISETKTAITKQENENYKSLPPITEESIYISNAGLILFHPFLEPYFGRTGLMKDGRFVDDHSKHRAVLLLQYLANGKNRFEEYDLALNKILCNVPLQEAVPFGIKLTKEEISISEELFSVFIERWPKLKNSSVEGLRASFILREGLLKLSNEGWNLKVEQRGYDILLENYPWIFSTVRTPWMEKTLTVEWI